MSDRPSESTRETGAEKARRYRRRQRVGEAVLRVPVRFDDLALELIEAGRLSESAALDRQNVEAAVAVIVDEWRRGSRHRR